VVAIKGKREMAAARGSGRTEGGAEWSATGLENQARVTPEGSTPSPSSKDD